MAAIHSHTVGVTAAAGVAGVTISGDLFAFSGSGGSTSTILTSSAAGSYLWTIESTSGSATWSLTNSTSQACTVNISNNNTGSAVIRCTVNGGSAFAEVTVDATTI